MGIDVRLLIMWRKDEPADGEALSQANPMTESSNVISKEAPRRTVSTADRLAPTEKIYSPTWWPASKR
jgi:hypothetical protein